MREVWVVPGREVGKAGERASREGRRKEAGQYPTKVDEPCSVECVLNVSPCFLLQ